MKKDIIDKSFNKAVNGGSAGFMAMTGQVFGLMWMRTMINHQYRYGGTISITFKKLYKEGGIPRFYRGIGFALMQAPISRFGDTAMNIGMMELLKDTELNTATKTFAGSCGAGIWRIGIMPLDTLKSSMQVNGSNGMNIIKDRLKTQGISTLYHGSLASGSATIVGHFPWFLTYNYLNTYLPIPDESDTHARIKSIGRHGIIGFCSSVISDTCSNSLRVIKTTKQTKQEHISYREIVKEIIKNDGIQGLLFRGLKTKLITNGIQGLLFTVIWKTIETS